MAYCRLTHLMGTGLFTPLSFNAERFDLELSLGTGELKKPALRPIGLAGGEWPTGVLAPDRFTGDSPRYAKSITALHPSSRDWVI